MKSLKLSLPLFLFLSLAVSFAPPKKYEYNSEEGKMSVTFPGEYSVEKTQGENNETIKIMCTLNDQTYFASYTLHEVDLTDQAGLAETSYESFLAAVKGQSIAKSEWRVKDNIGIKAQMRLPDNDVQLEYRVVLAGRIQYQLVSMAVKGSYDEKAATAFFNSFKITN